MTGEPNQTEEKGTKLKVTGVAGGFVRLEVTVRDDDPAITMRQTEAIWKWAADPAREWKLEPQK
jgi:hypothetical protein